MANSYNPNTITSQQAKVIGNKPISYNMAQKYGNKVQKQQYRQAKREARLARKQSKHLGRQYRKNLKAAASENFKEKQLMHGTIRQGLAEGATIVSQALAPAVSRGIVSAVSQNTSGGVKPETNSDNNSDSKDKLTKGPMNAIVYSANGRDEE